MLKQQIAQHQMQQQQQLQTQERPSEMPQSNDSF
jgi:hypothetical protein